MYKSLSLCECVITKKNPASSKIRRVLRVRSNLLFVTKNFDTKCMCMCVCVVRACGGISQRRSTSSEICVLLQFNPIILMNGFNESQGMANIFYSMYFG